ncbi:GNAT family N-acyltransferase [Defluviimonas aestuarii]|uniref:GNAT family N-acetyltransferase n=1 Tax=Albidovulum aestuarii TaxID=1130726 RepID=UPI00249C3F2F|nr:GNAT family N-acetyltransferase [Defluviimonas aestuarii]MDI3336969.1 GNAT family N-acyltransferase [Defluviimonas aestuarii]
MQPMRRGRYLARLAGGGRDVERAQMLRGHAFRGGAVGARDTDRFDNLCRHVLIEEAEGGALVATFRLMPLGSGREIGQCYSAQVYDLSALERMDRPMLELGRFCLAPGQRDPDILRLAWGAITAEVDAISAGLLFGCSSFAGTDAAIYRDAFGWLATRHLAPPDLRPARRAPESVALAEGGAAEPDPGRALRTLPPLLRAYVGMGGWVGDHAVIDRELGTMHVFTGLEVDRVPAARARSLRIVAGSGPA